MMVVPNIVLAAVSRSKSNLSYIIISAVDRPVNFLSGSEV